MKRLHHNLKIHLQRFQLGKAITVVFAIITLAGASGCTGDDLPACPPLTVSVTVDDLNYSNYADISGEKGISVYTPFSEIIQDMEVTLQEFGTGKILEEYSIQTAGNEPICPISFTTNQPGKYILTIWGNVSTRPSIQDNESLYKYAQTEDKSIYVSRDTLEYVPGGNNPKIALKRVTGKLVVENTNLPSYLTEISMSGSNLSKEVSSTLKFSGSQNLSELFTITPSGTPEYRITSILPPSSPDNDTEITNQYLMGSNIIMTTEGVKVKIERNKITYLRYVWDDDLNMTIFLNVDGNWEQVSNMDVNEE